MRSPNVAHRRDGDAPVQVAADGVVLGRAPHGNALEWHVGSPARGPARHHAQDCLVAWAEAPTIDDRSPARAAGGRGGGRPGRNSVPGRQQLFRSREIREDPYPGAVEVIVHGKTQAKPRRKRAQYLDTRSGRIRLAAIPDNSAASIEAFVRANVKTGTTLLTDGHRSYPGLTDYRHDPRTVGKMAGHIVLPWIHRVFALMKRWGLGTYHGLRRKHLDTYLNEFVFRYNRRFYRHVSFETMLGLASHHHPTSYWDIIGRANPRKRDVPIRRVPRRRKTAAGMRQDGPASAQTEGHQAANAGVQLDMDKPGTTQ